MKTFLTLALVVTLLSGCATLRESDKIAPVSVEAIVERYGEDFFRVMLEDGSCSESKFLCVDLELSAPAGLFSKKLRVYCSAPLPEDHPFRQVNARVRFQVAKKFLAGIITDPRRPHDTSWLYTEDVVALTLISREPNQTAHPTTL